MATYECPGCSYSYDEVKGHDYEGFPPGTPWSAVPDDWSCPECAVRDKEHFELVSGEAPANVQAAPTQAPTQALAPKPKPTKPVVAQKPVAKAQVAAPASQPAKKQANRDPYLKWICLTCGHIYDEKLGDPFEGVAAGTRFSDVPESWVCTDCGTSKEDYILFEEE